MVFYKTDTLYNTLLYISSLPQIAKFVNPDDTELSMYKSVSSIHVTECASVLNVLLYCISPLPRIAKFVNPGDILKLYMYKSLV